MGEAEEGESWLQEGMEGILETLFTLLSRSGENFIHPADSVSIGVDDGMLLLQNVLNPFVLFLATLGVLLAAIRLLWQRRLDPMLDMVRGLLTTIIATFFGLFLVNSLLLMGGRLTTLVFRGGGQAGDGGSPLGFIPVAQEVYPSIMRVALDADESGFFTEAAAQAVTYIINTAVILGLVAQIVVLSLTQAVVYLIACILPLAAASTMIPNMKIFSKVLGWLVACVLYQPFILLIYLAGLIVLQASEEGTERYFIGAAIMLLATGALPVLMKLMGNPTVWLMAGVAGGAGAIGSGGGGGGGGGGGSEGGGSEGRSRTPSQERNGGEAVSYSGSSGKAQEQAGTIQGGLPATENAQIKELGTGNTQQGGGTSTDEQTPNDSDTGAEGATSVQPALNSDDRGNGAGTHSGGMGGYPRLVAAAGATVPGAATAATTVSGTAAPAPGGTTGTGYHADSGVAGDAASGASDGGSIEATHAPTPDGPPDVTDSPTAEVPPVANQPHMTA